MKKRLTSLLLCLVLLISAVPGVQAETFPDISDGETAVAAATLQGIGVVSGTPDGTFQPDDTLTRAQVCVMAVNMMGLADKVNTYSRKTLFTDVPAGSWYNGYVNLAYREGIINGYGNGKFGPDDIITYGQLATILLRMLGYTKQEIGSVWPVDYTAFATRLGLSNGMNLKDNQSITRGDGAMLFYRALKCCTNGSDREYYRSISGVNSAVQSILLDTNASFAGRDELVKVYVPQEGLVHYDATRTQSEALEGCFGQLLFDASGKVMGFVPDSESYEDIIVSSATAAALKSSSGSSLRINADVTVIANGETYTYHNGGYLQLNQAKGKTARVFYDADGSVLCIYLGSGTAVSSAAVVAESNSVLGEMERLLGLFGKSYALTKNGVNADKDDLARYDVGYYDSASGTLRVSDYRVSGCLNAASPSVSAAQTITVAGCTMEVLECAWDSLKSFRLGDKLTVLLTDDCKVAAAYSYRTVSADMVGVLDTQGRSVTLAGSGLTLSPSEMDHSESMRGTLVRITAAVGDELRCSKAISVSGVLDIENRTLDGLELASGCSFYEWAGAGYVYDLVGERGQYSRDLESIFWTDRLSSSCISYYHTNSAGQVDAVLLKNVTGNLYTYGKVSGFNRNEEEESAENSDFMSGVSNYKITLTNASGTSEYLPGITDTDDMYVGIALGVNLSGNTTVAKIQELKRVLNGENGEFYRQDGMWYVQLDGTVYPIAEAVQVSFTAADCWKTGEDGLMAAVADGCELTFYLDRDVSLGGQVRIVTAS